MIVRVAAMTKSMTTTAPHAAVARALAVTEAHTLLAMEAVIALLLLHDATIAFK